MFFRVFSRFLLLLRVLQPFSCQEIKFPDFAYYNLISDGTFMQFSQQNWSGQAFSYYFPSDQLQGKTLKISSWIRALSTETRVLAEKSSSRNLQNSEDFPMFVRKTDLFSAESSDFTQKIPATSGVFAANRVVFELSDFSTNVLGVFLNETSIFVTFNANSGSDSLVFAVNPLNFLENATFSRLSELGWFWILIESQYNEDFSPKSLKIHWIYREKYVFFQVDLSQKTLVFPAIGALFLNVGSSLVNSLCECVLDAVRAYSPVFPMDFADYKGIWKLSGSDLHFLINFEFNHGNLFNETGAEANFFQREPTVFLNNNNVLLGEFILRTSTEKSVIIATNFTIFSDFTVSFWFRFEKTPNNGRFSLFFFSTACVPWRISIEGSSLYLNDTLICSEIMPDNWYFFLAFSRPFTLMDVNSTEGLLKIFVSSTKTEQKCEKILYFPEISKETCEQLPETSQISLGSASKTSFPVLFKQLKLYKGSFFSNCLETPSQCEIFVGARNYYSFSGDSTSSQAFPDCLLVKSGDFYNELANTYTSATNINLSEFCPQNTTRISLSGQEISRCERCFVSSESLIACPEPGICKDGFLQISYEECDDGLDDELSVCSHYCDRPKDGYKCRFTNKNQTECVSICGDGIWINGSESCDDGNLINGDGCDINCRREGGFLCAIESGQTYTTCRRCAEFCSGCNGEGVCVSCASPYRNFNGSCYAQCPAKTFEKGGACYECTGENCGECAWNYSGNKEKCNKCLENFVLVDNLTCNSSCPAQNYYILDDTHCNSCPKNCSQCFFNQSLKEIQCTGCIEGFFLYLADCVNECEKGYFFNGFTCEKCMENCSQCSNNLTCDECSASYVITLQKTCAEACGSHEYNDSTGHCRECDIACGACENSSENCVNCSQGYFLDVSHQCLQCSSPCLECANNSYCTKCSLDKNYQLLNNICQPICSTSGYFLDETLQKCVECAENCLICSNVSFCEKCKPSYVFLNDVCSQKCGAGQLFVNSSCVNCETIAGLYPNCQEICGDGILYSNDPQVCDDGNLIDGDGCSSTCFVEENFDCPRNSSSKKSYCYDKRPVECEILFSEANVKEIYLKFNREVIFQRNFTEYFVAKLENLTNSQYNYTMSAISNGIILFTFQYFTSFRNATVQITLQDPSKILDKNNISFDTTAPNLTFSVHLPRYVYLSPEKAQQIQDMAQATETASIAAVSFSAAPLALIQAMSIFWCLVDAMQIANFYLLINIDYPQNAEMFFKILSASNLKFLPNYFEHIFNLNFTLQEINGVALNIDPVIQAPARFAKLNMTSSFIKNAGGVFGLMLIVLVFFLLLSLSAKIIEERKSSGTIAKYVVKLYRMIRYDLIFRIQLTIFLDLTLATLLQLRVCSGKEKTYLFGFILSVVCLCYLCYLFYVVLRVVNDDLTINQDKTHKETYGTLFDGLVVEKTIPRNYQPIILIRKFIFCCILVYFHDYPFVTVSFISVIQVISALILVKYKPFITNTQNIVAILSEIFLSIVIIMILVIQINETKTEEIDNGLVNSQLKLGWALISFCLSVLVLYLFLFGYTQYVNYKKAKEILLEVQKNAKVTLQKFKTKILERTNSKSSRDNSVTDSKKRESLGAINDGEEKVHDRTDSSFRPTSKFSKLKKEMEVKEEIEKEL